MFSIKENDAPNLKKCVMLCDVPIHPKLDNYELTKFFNSHNTTLLCGKPGSGKTSLLYSLFQSKKLLKKCYNTIYLFQPLCSRGSMSDSIFDVLPEEQKYSELTFDNLNSVVECIKEENKGNNSCIIFDDMAAYLKDASVFKLLKNLICNRRHLGVSVYFLVQTYKSISKDIRKLFSNIVLFKVSKNEMETVFEEIIERDKKMIIPLCNLVYDQPYNFLFINTNSQRLFKNFNEIIVN